jgi:hypothetical protein
VDMKELTGSADRGESGRRAYPAASLIEQAMPQREPESDFRPGEDAQRATAQSPSQWILTTSTRSSGGYTRNVTSPTNPGRLRSVTILLTCTRNLPRSIR